MKIQRLSIPSFRHLKNLDFDFTYQSGERKGQPLDKICLIGQSATGKTSILEYIKSEINKPNSTTFKSFETGKLFYFTSEIITTKSINKLAGDVNINKSINQPLSANQINIMRSIPSQKILEFSEITNEIIWDFIFEEIYSYRNKLTQKGSELIHKGLHIDYKKFESEMEDWKIKNPNPLIDLAEKCLNPILKKLNLEVDIINTSNPIPLKPINSENPVPVKALSTGTKQLILNAVPLYKMDTKDSIIMLDEPERSLFPDIQIELIDFYRNIAKKAQFIVATHSPFIAAAFEDEERFILYFDAKGNVAFKLGSAPIGDDPNDILKSDFGLQNLMNEKGIKAYKDYLNLKQRLQNESDQEKKEALLKELTLLGDKYKF